MKKTLLDWLTYMQGIHVSAIDMGLSRVLPVAERLNLINSAKNSYVFTVAGTNGKGSTTATIAQICQQAGYKTALYQSPHLSRFNERVKINGTPVDDERLIQAFEQVEQARIDSDLSLSFFEMTTLAAFLIFAETQCDVWVLEVGLGGRLDVVNIIDPNLAVITNVGIDHVDWLGDDREKIGYEKAGILREGITCVFGDVDMPSSVQTAIEQHTATCYQLGTDFDFLTDIPPTTSQTVEPTSSQLKQMEYWQYSNSAISVQLPYPKLSLVNASNAITAVLASDLAIAMRDIHQALTQVKLVGRFDYRESHQRRWLFDVGHNEHGVTFLINQLESQLPKLLPATTGVKLIKSKLIKSKPVKVMETMEHSQRMRQERVGSGQIHILFSMLKDKDIDTVVRLLNDSKLPLVHWYLAPIDPTYVPRATDINELVTIVGQYLDGSKFSKFENIEQATQAMIERSQEQDLLLVCGSFHTIGETLSSLKQTVNEP